MLRHVSSTQKGEKLKYLVLGGSGGIGQAVTRRLLRDGHEVYSSYFANEVNFRSDYSCGIHELYLDMTNPKELRSKLQDLDDFDGLIHCAGIARAEKIQDINDSNIQDMLYVNLQSAIVATSVLFPGMIKRKFGRLVFFGSIVGREGGIGLSAYAATKSGLEGFTRSIHKEIILRKSREPDLNMTVNLIRPGYVKTSMTHKLNEKIRENIETKSTLGRFLEPEEVSEFVCFLLKPKSEYISGRFHDIDGGQEL